MELREQLRKDLRDAEFRHAYADEHLNLVIASQIKVLREKQKLSQKELATKLGTKQAGISRLESANYSGWSVRVLKKLAEAFDLRLRISFEEFGTLWKEVDGFGREKLERRPFPDDPEFHAQPGSALPGNTVSQSHYVPRSAIEGLMVYQQAQASNKIVVSIDDGRRLKKPPVRASAYVGLQAGAERIALCT